MSSRFPKSTEWLARAKKIIPSASQTYSKGYKYYCEGAAPAFLDRGLGAHVWDVDGNEYIDTVLGLGAVTIGYHDPEINEAIQKQLEKGISFTLPNTLEVKLAEKLVKILPAAGMVRFVKNGSDATSAAVRLARAFTGRDLVLSYGYHGWHDWFIGITENNRGVPKSVQALTLDFPYNNLEAFQKLLDQYRGKIAAVIMEPVQLELPNPGYLESIRELTRKNGIVLIFDEVVTGFRYALNGAHGYFGVTPDLACFGKGMANGASISALVGKSEILRLLDDGVFVSMTFGGDAIAIVSALETIQILERKESYPHLWNLERLLVDGIGRLIEKSGLAKTAYTRRFPAHTALLFQSVDGRATSLDLQSYFQQEVLKKGVLYLGVHNLCLAHTEEDIHSILNAYAYGLEKVADFLRSDTKLEQFFDGEKIRPVFSRR